MRADSIWQKSKLKKNADVIYDIDYVDLLMLSIFIPLDCSDSRFLFKVEHSIILKFYFLDMIYICVLKKYVRLQNENFWIVIKHGLFI